jgi:hypothetical protein
VRRVPEGLGDALASSPDPAALPRREKAIVSEHIARAVVPSAPRPDAFAEDGAQDGPALWCQCGADADVTSFKEMIAKAKRMALRHGIAKGGQRIIIGAGVPFAPRIHQRRPRRPPDWR